MIDIFLSMNLQITSVQANIGFPVFSLSGHFVGKKNQPQIDIRSHVNLRGPASRNPLPTPESTKGLTSGKSIQYFWYRFQFYFRLLKMNKYTRSKSNTRNSCIAEDSCFQQSSLDSLASIDLFLDTTPLDKTLFRQNSLQLSFFTFSFKNPTLLVGTCGLGLSQKFPPVDLTVNVGKYHT